ncbi:MAG TPA: peptidoglycan DD-metalloendopeptidase family protein [Vicinamibacteria bacterium]
MKQLIPPAAFLLVLLPTHVPWWLETARPVQSDPLTIVLGTIGRNDTLAAALQDVLPPGAVESLVSAARPVHDLARIAVGRPFGVALGPDGLMRAFTYGIDELRTLRVVRRGEGLQAEVLVRRPETTLAVVSATIDSSLFAAIERAGEDDQLALDLADVYAWDVDFNTEIRQGDSFRVAVEKLTLDGTFVRYGRILGAELVRGGRVLRAFRHEGASGASYHDADGRPLRKAFLRSPLRFTRISSRFSRSRLHPVLRVRRAHFGVDYAAPVGTPVSAAADGVVTFSGWLGGYGRTVRIRHANGYETLYGHLSRVAVRTGQRVAQGTLVGAVGATGLATGPHLDYRMARNGQYLDPLKVALPPAEPIAPAEREAFADASRRLLAMLGADATRTAARR